MKALLIAVHGSRRPSANAEMAALAESIARIAHDRFDTVRCGFLQLTEPQIPDVIATLVEEGAEEIVLFPFFIAAGSHVLSDIPAIVAAASATHSGVRFRVGPHLGACKGIDRFILDAVG
ncbi:MAG: CbiX/SirB N-terminal domain-containing protein [Desulfosarcinaceae bacterium]|nr:CbiX/SirB N-terminal domain-containing protein [Desulfosarcinaceae bacterium]